MASWDMQRAGALVAWGLNMRAEGLRRGLPGRSLEGARGLDGHPKQGRNGMKIILAGDFNVDIFEGHRDESAEWFANWFTSWGINIADSDMPRRKRLHSRHDHDRAVGRVGSHAHEERRSSAARCSHGEVR